MSLYLYYYKIFIMIVWTETVKPMAVLKKPHVMADGLDSDIAEYISSKSNLPNEMVLPKTALVNSGDNDATYLLSKLPDEELLKVLNEQPDKSEYYLNDLVKFALGSKSTKDYNLIPNDKLRKPFIDSNKVFANEKQFKPPAIFRLDNKQVDPWIHGLKNDIDPKYVAVQKLNNVLYSHPLQTLVDKHVDDEDKKELLFDVLVAQLKSLCCNKNKLNKSKAVNVLQTLLHEFNPQDYLQKSHVSEYKIITDRIKVPNEHMFLIINDEIKSNGSEELISVDPDSLGNNSSVLLLGPITTPLTDPQLKLVMRRISSELLKVEYLPLLQQLSEGTLSDQNIRLMKSLVTGPETRRYIKPHRCNHQSKLSKIYGGAKWLICTGYLNFNTPSLYD